MARPKIEWDGHPDDDRLERRANRQQISRFSRKNAVFLHRLYTARLKHKEQKRTRARKVNSCGVMRPKTEILMMTGSNGERTGSKFLFLTKKKLCFLHKLYTARLKQNEQKRTRARKVI